MGCSNPHPHGQVWSLSAVPSLPATELDSLKKYSNATQPSDAPRGPLGRSCLLCDYVHFEASVASDQGRVVLKNDHWIALVPWWAIWPFEIMRTLSRSSFAAVELNPSMQSFRISGTSLLLSTSQPWRRRRSLKSCLNSLYVMTTSSPALSPTPWAFTNDQPLRAPMQHQKTRTRRTSLICTSTLHPHCFVAPPLGSSSSGA